MNDKTKKHTWMTIGIAFGVIAWLLNDDNGLLLFAISVSLGVVLDHYLSGPKKNEDG